MVNASAAVWATPSDLAVSFSYSPAVAYATVQVNFDASTSFGGVNGYTTYLWDFGDSSTAATNSPVITHIFNSAGSYSVSLTVNDTFGFRNNTVQAISVLKDSIAPVTSDNYDGLAHSSPFTIVLTAQDSQSGVAATYYKVNRGQTQIISANGQPQIVTEGSNNTLEYWSVDFAGNIENPRNIAGIKLEFPVASVEPTQTPPPTIKPTQKPEANGTVTPTPASSSSPGGSQNSPTPVLNGQNLPFFAVSIIVGVISLAILVLVVIWFKRK